VKRVLKVNNALRIITLILLLGLVTGIQLHGQFQPTPVKKSTNLVTLNGKNFYLHEVLQGHTLYSIAKAYGVSEAEITEANSIIKNKGLTAGLVIRIPASGDVKVVEQPSPQAQYLIHKVQAKETLSSLSRQYGVKIDDIRAINPDTKWGLSIGQEIKIPKDKITLAQPAVKATNETQPRQNEVASLKTTEETLSDLPCRQNPTPHKQDEFNLFIVLPLNIAENDTLVFSDTLDEDHFRFYEFLEGAYLAIDSLRKSGLNLNLHVLDTERNPAVIKEILAGNQLDQADLIIGPAFKSELELMAPVADKMRIPLVNPLSPTDYTQGNPYVFQIRTKPDRQEAQVCNYLAGQYKKNTLVICRSAEKNSPEFLSFYDRLRAQMKAEDPGHKAQPKIVYFSEIERDFFNEEKAVTRLDNYLSKTTPNYVIIASSDEVFATEIINQLNLRSSSYDLTTFGMYPGSFGSLDLENLFNVNLEVASDLEENPFVDYQDPDVQNFSRIYKLNWNVEPSRWSYQGFDITYYFTRALFYFGRNLTNSVPCWNDFLNHKTMQTSLRFTAQKNGNGFENEAIPIIRYSRQELVRKKVN
jgi:LysM repeat protein